ncbi:MAG: hypothetical protein Sylvanvirus6_11 [Sylvanvirus sp.]|uniref:Uncharacterized protein n=1 Tax=Sylvanvirus sp. TaxID=2487774 RepID=A0A3G5AHM6_9VIRU|nr:MAG: hypothetical protein Sylvanvirus6_11 [Sylvanvirus sp.]
MEYVQGYQDSMSSRCPFRIVVSLSVVPWRLNRVDQVLRSLDRQTQRVDQIYLHIPWRLERTQQPYPSIPESLQTCISQMSTPLRVCRGQDYGPITKLAPTLDLEKDPFTILLAFDDDWILHPRKVEVMIFSLIKFFASPLQEILRQGQQDKIPQMITQGASQLMSNGSRISKSMQSFEPPKVAVTGRGWHVGGKIWSSPSFFDEIDNPLTLKEISIVGGCCGFASFRCNFPSSCQALLQERASLPSHLQSCAFFHDDMMISAVLEKRGVQKFVHPNRCMDPMEDLEDGLSSAKILFLKRLIPLVHYYYDQVSSAD